MAKSKLPSPGVFLQLATACFFLVLGICGIFPNVDESIFSLNNANLVIEVIFGVLELICALVLFVGIFTFVPKKWLSLSSLIIFFFWILTIIYTQFFNYLVINSAGIAFRPSVMEWILNLLLDLVVLACVWVVNRHYSD
jgi:hypothetical protein